MKETERNGSFRRKIPKTQELNNEKKPPTKSCLWAFQPILSIQITKLNKAEHYYIGIKWGETKKEVKRSKGQGLRIFAAPAKFYRGCKTSKLARLLLELSVSALFML